jgi:hypothetical protein
MPPYADVFERGPLHFSYVSDGPGPWKVILYGDDDICNWNIINLETDEKVKIGSVMAWGINQAHREARRRNEIWMSK